MRPSRFEPKISKLSKWHFFNALNTILISVIFLGLTNCAVKYTLREGNNLQTGESAILKCDEHSPIRLLSVDGRTPSLGKYYGYRRNLFIWGLFGQLDYYGFEIELVPGKHILLVDYFNEKGYTEQSIESIELVFSVQKDHQYTIITSLGNYKTQIDFPDEVRTGGWNAKIIDVCQESH